MILPKAYMKFCAHAISQVKPANAGKKFGDEAVDWNKLFSTTTIKIFVPIWHVWSKDIPSTSLCIKCHRNSPSP